MTTDLSIIVPTLNEAANLPELVRRVDASLREAGWTYELIVVDDGSTDGTSHVMRELAEAERHPVRLIERGRGAEGGLSGAVLAGFEQARGEVLAVMDGDLQHPPEMLPALIAALRPPAEAGSPRAQGSDGDGGSARVATSEGAEMVVGSRYVPGGSVAERWGGFRKLNSRLATWLARPFAANVRDPMSGFFALPRHVYERGRHLSPLGYKILLELMCKCRPQPVVEVPIHFGQRHAGDSKLTVKEQFRYLEHLSRLYDYTFPRASPIVKFGIVVALAWCAGVVAFAVLLKSGLGPVAAIAVAYALAVGVAAVFHLRYVRTQRRFLVRPTPWRDFLLSALVEWLTAVGVAAYLVVRTSAPAAEKFLTAFGAATLVRYVLRKELLLDVRGLRPEEPVTRDRTAGPT